MRSVLLIVCFAAMASIGGPASAQEPNAANADNAGAAPATLPPTGDCQKEADARNLHGADRAAFRRDCLRNNRQN